MCTVTWGCAKKSEGLELSVIQEKGSEGNDLYGSWFERLEFSFGASDYLHRAGRAGRAGKKGFVFSLYRNKDLELIN